MHCMGMIAGDDEDITPSMLWPPTHCLPSDTGSRPLEKDIVN